MQWSEGHGQISHLSSASAQGKINHTGMPFRQCLRNLSIGSQKRAVIVPVNKFAYVVEAM